MAEGDWNFEKPASRHEQPLPGSAVVVVPAERTPSEMLPQMQAHWDAEEAASDPLQGLSDDQVETARTAAEMILGEDPSGFAAVFDGLSAPVQNKIFGLMAASPHLRGLNLIDAIERKLTLSEAAEAETWLRGLSPQHKQLLRG